MKTICRNLLSLLAIVGLAGCADTALSPAPGELPGPRRTQTSSTADIWNMADVEADLSGLFPFSLDTSQAGTNAIPYVNPDVSADETRLCRDHFRGLDLWWDGGYGTMSFHMDPPILFVGYRPGTFRSNRGLVFQRAIYETIQPTEATDPAGNVWRFQGRFNALCRGGQFEIGPIVFNGQVIVAQDPLTRPVLVRRAGAGGGCDTELAYEIGYDPYDDGSGFDSGCEGDIGGGEGGSGIQFEPGDYTGGETVDWQTGVGNGGRSVCGENAVVEEVWVDAFNAESGEWETWLHGYATTC